MAQSYQRDYDEYELLKKEAQKSINRSNASDVFASSKIEFLEKLKNLNINNIREIEDLYLIGCKICHSLAYNWAEKQTALGKSTFDEALGKFATDEILAELQNHFNQTNSFHFWKIKEIETRFSPSKQSWSAIHARIYGFYSNIQTKEKVTALNELINKQIVFLDKKRNEPGAFDTNFTDLTDKLSADILDIAKEYTTDLVKSEKKLKQKLMSVFNEAKENLKTQDEPRKVIDEVANATMVFCLGIKNTHYSYETNKPGGRKHYYEIISEDLDEKFIGMKGDHLKTAILQYFKSQLEKAFSIDELDAVVEGIKSSKEIEILKKGQGIMTRFFSLKTSSIKALEQMIEDQKNNIIDSYHLSLA